MLPKKSEFEKQNPSALGTKADSVGKIAEQLKNEMDELTTAQNSIRSECHGRFVDHLEDLIKSRLVSLTNAHDGIAQVQKALSDGGQTLTSKHNDIATMVDEITKAGFAIADDWTISNAPGNTDKGADRTSSLKDFQDQLKPKLDALNQADEDVMNALFKADQKMQDNSNVPQVSPPGPDPQPQPQPDPKDPKDPKEPKEPKDPQDPQDGDGHKDSMPTPAPNGVKPYPVLGDNPGDQDHLPAEKKLKVGEGCFIAPTTGGPYDGNQPTDETDAKWREALAHFKQGDPLPRPESVKDPQLKVLAAAASQQGVSYAWGGNQDANGPSEGTLKYEKPGGGAHINRDDLRVGYDCGGLARYAEKQGAGIDIMSPTDTQIASGMLTPVPDADRKPGDLIYFDNDNGKGTHHVAIYIGNGMVVNAYQSGEPVEVTPISQIGGKQHTYRSK